MSLRYGWRLLSFDAHEDGVFVIIESVESGFRHQVSARYLIGADGARSAVRRQLGISYGGETGIKMGFLRRQNGCGLSAHQTFAGSGFYNATC